MKAILEGRNKVNPSTIVAIAMVFAVYVLASQFYLKKKLKKNRSLSAYSIRIEGVIYCYRCCLAAVVCHRDTGLVRRKRYRRFPPFVATIPLFALFFLQGVNRAIEQWLLHRQKKAYWHEILSSVLRLLLFAVIWAGEK